MQAEENPFADEGTALLSGHGSKVVKRTPLPIFQLGILFAVSISEPIASQSIYPYINQLIIELGITGGDKRKVGYYAGLIESLFYAIEAITILQWGRISDRIGRKPVLLIGLAGSALSMVCFGLSRTFWTLVLSRCLCGMLNGNIGVVKSALGELTDPTNRSEAVVLLPTMWAIGSSIALMVGGSLSRPYDHYPNVFAAEFWRKFPYFLPCLSGASYACIAFLITLLFFKETLPQHHRLFNHSSPATVLPTNTPRKPRLCELLTYPVIISVANFFSLVFMDISFLALAPLFMSTPIEFGGLGFSPATIGCVLGARGACISIIQLLFSAKFIRRFGEKRMFLAGMLTFPIISLLFPLISAVARQNGVTWIGWSLLAFSLSLIVVSEMSFSCIFNYITASSTGKGSLGATNGIAQTMASFARAIGPWLATSLFAFSSENKLLGGYAVYALFFIFSCLSLVLAAHLPNQIWEQCD